MTYQCQAEVSVEGINIWTGIIRREEWKTAFLGATRERPVYGHAIVQGILALFITVFLASSCAWDLTARATATILSIVGVATSYTTPLSPMYVRLMDGTLSGFNIVLECSGLITVAIFSFISTLTIGLLKGSLLKKIVWFVLSISVGLFWNINRLAVVIIIAYRFGLSIFSFTHYFVGPFIDFAWVVSMWALGMSLIQKEEIVA